MKKYKIFVIAFFSIIYSYSQSKKQSLLQYINSTVTVVSENGSGSGFIIDIGKVITNLHVLEGSESGYIIINGSNEKHKIKGYYNIDSTDDLIILSIPTLKNNPLRLANSKIKKGDSVFMFDDKLNSNKFIQNGKIEFIGNSESNSFMRTSIPVNQGNSGSALINSKGKVVGVIFAGLFTPENLAVGENVASYAINLFTIKNLISKNSDTVKKLNNSKGAHYYYFSGLKKSDIKDFNGAISDYNKSIKLNPNLFSSYYNRGLLKLQIRELRDLTASINDFNSVIKIMPDFAYAHNNKGLAKILLKDFENAIKDFDISIKLDSNFGSAYSSRGLAKASIEDYENAILDFNRAIEIEPDNKLFFFNRAGIKYFSGDEKGGCKDFKTAKKFGFLDAQILIDKFCK